jgi:hypothetical protein
VKRVSAVKKRERKKKTMAMPDINETDLLREEVETDSNADPNKFFAPPLLDDAEYECVLGIGDRGITVTKQKDKNTGTKTGPAFLTVHLHAKTVDAAGNVGLGAIDNPTSIVMQSQGSSRLAIILQLIDVKVPGKCSLGELKQLAEQALAQNPRIKITTRWEAQIKLADGTYQIIRTGQRNFPPELDGDGKPTGRFSPEVVDPKTGIAATAQVRIQKYAKA